LQHFNAQPLAEQIMLHHMNYYFVCCWHIFVL
jgi:hypothetical protein